MSFSKDAVSDAYDSVWWCFNNNNCMVSNNQQKRNMLLDISHDNSTVWTAYNVLKWTLPRLSGTLASSMLDTVNALPTISEFRLDEVYCS